MKPCKVRYLRRFNLGEFNHEELEVEYMLDDNTSGDSAKVALSAARDDVVKCSTPYLKAIKEKEKRA